MLGHSQAGEDIASLIDLMQEQNNDGCTTGAHANHGAMNLKERRNKADNAWEKVQKSMNKAIGSFDDAKTSAGKASSSVGQLASTVTGMARKFIPKLQHLLSHKIVGKITTN